MTKYKIDTIRDLYADIVSVTTGTRSEHRYALADVYQMTLAAEGFFPKKPRSLLSIMPANLRRKVDDTCSLCIKEKAMETYITNAKLTLLEYKLSLKKWLGDNQIEFDEYGESIRVSVQDLNSNVEKL